MEDNHDAGSSILTFFSTGSAVLFVSSAASSSAFRFPLTPFDCEFSSSLTSAAILEVVAVAADRLESVAGAADVEVVVAAVGFFFFLTMLFRLCTSRETPSGRAGPAWKIWSCNFFPPSLAFVAASSLCALRSSICSSKFPNQQQHVVAGFNKCSPCCRAPAKVLRCPSARLYPSLTDPP